MQKILVDEYTKVKGLSIRESSIGERTQGLVIGIERLNTRILNPDSNTIFEWGDIVWLVGDRKKIQELIRKSNDQTVKLKLCGSKNNAQSHNS